MCLRSVVFKWLLLFHPSRGDTELQPTFKIKISQDDDVCTLQMSGVTLKMSEVYKCVAVNPVGEAVCAANVSVVGEYKMEDNIVFLECVQTLHNPVQVLQKIHSWK